MMLPPVLRRFGLASGLAVLVSCSGAGSGAGTPSPEPVGAAEFEAIFEARADSARGRFTPADVEFVHGMLAHHAQALIMAGLADTHGASPRIQTLAARILNSQRDEIASMESWLRERDLRVPELEIAGLSVRMDGEEHPAGSHGMLTPEEMRELDRARGTEFDRRFLTGMIRHHQGAVGMVEELFRTDAAAQDEAIFRLASDIQVDQRTEVARMRRMLEALPGPNQ